MTGVQTCALPISWDIKESQRRRAAASVDRVSIRRKLSRLKELYVNEVIDLDEYRRDYEKYTSQLNEPTDAVDERRPNFDAIKAVLSKNFRDSYNRLDRAEKRSLWHSIIKEIRIDKERQITSIVFL